MKLGRITLSTQELIANPDKFAVLFSAAKFLPLSVTANHLGKTEYMGYCSQFDDMKEEGGLLPAYEFDSHGKATKRVISLIKRG